MSALIRSCSSPCHHPAVRSRQQGAILLVSHNTWWRLHSSRRGHVTGGGNRKLRKAWEAPNHPWMRTSNSSSTSNSTPKISRRHGATLEKPPPSSSSSSSSSSHALTNNWAPAEPTTPPTPMLVGRTRGMATAVAWSLACLTVGYTAGYYQQHQQHHHHHHPPPGDPARPPRVLPDGIPRTCCQGESHHSSQPPPPPPPPQQQQQPHDYHDDPGILDPLDDARLTEEQRQLPRKLRRIVASPDLVWDGRRNDTAPTRPFLQGARLGHGRALCIVAPTRLHHVVEVVRAAVQADCVIVVQGQNTGLTGGSVPRSSSLIQNTKAPAEGATTPDPPDSTSFRPTVVLSMKHLNRIFPLDGGERVVCLAGAGLASLQRFLDRHFPDREAHSVLGSTFLDPTAAAGVALGSGGTQIRKGPAYTERALYLQVVTNKWQEKVVQVVNTLGIAHMHERDLPKESARLMDTAPYIVDTWSRWIHDGYERTMRYSEAQGHGRAPASDVTYAARLCDPADGDTVSRSNADTRGPFPNRSEGKVIILATVHDTFPKPQVTRTFWLGFDSLETAQAFRKQVCLVHPDDVPISMEYMNRDAFDVIDRSGRFLGGAIRWVGTSSPYLRQLWNMKLRVESLPWAGAPLVVDRFLHLINPILPPLLPRDIMATGRQLDHHVALTVGEFGQGNLERFLDRMQKFCIQHGKKKIVLHECTPAQASSLTAFRFVAAPAFRTWCVGVGAQGFSVDYALPKRGEAVPTLSATNVEGDSHPTAVPLKRMRYSHFGCNVVHEDLAYALDVDVHHAKKSLKMAVEHECGGRLPAEHGHGTEYIAPPETRARWQEMDPLNVLNPGIGGLSENYKYQS